MDLSGAVFTVRVFPLAVVPCTTRSLLRAPGQRMIKIVTGTSLPRNLRTLMAELVLGIGAPHTPFFPGIAKAQGTAARVTVLFDSVRQKLESARPDLILIFTADHFVSFFFNNMPTFCIGTFAHADGPHELSRMMPQYSVRGHPAFAQGLLRHGIESGFDLACAEELKLDHAALVPLHFFTPQMNIAVVPVPGRCSDLCRRALEGWCSCWSSPCDGSCRSAVSNCAR